MSLRPGENHSTEQLFDVMGGQLAELRRCMLGRRNRDRACMTLTDAYVTLEGLGRRLQTVEFSGAPVARDEEEDLPEAVDPLTLADLFAPESDDEEAAAAVAAGESIEGLRLRYFRVFLDYLLVGCTSPEQAMKKLLAFTRRVRPQAMAGLGLSQSDVARILGESRQVVNAREQRLVEKPLQARGVRGFHGLGGQRSEAHRSRCQKAQMGNKNRSGGGGS